MRNKTVRVGILGGGTVGKATYDLLSKNKEIISARTGRTYEVVKIGVRDIHKQRGIPTHLLTDNLATIIEDPTVDIVVEAIGKCNPAEELVRGAVLFRKSVVTANKELVACKGEAIRVLAEENNVKFLFDAAVGGGIPIVQTLQSGLSGNRISKVEGILNGTTNLILSLMTQENLSFDEALSKAQELGFAEADPCYDISGKDTAFKLLILAWIITGRLYSIDQVDMIGIDSISKTDQKNAKNENKILKLIGTILISDQNTATFKVRPIEIDSSHPFYQIHNEQNAVSFHGDFQSPLHMSGPGAGGAATASSIVSDLMSIG